MIMMNSCGMLIFLRTFDMVFIRKEGQFAEKNAPVFRDRGSEFATFEKRPQK